MNYNLFIICLLSGEHLSWMNWVLYASVLLSFPMLLSFKEKYRRLNVDLQINVDDQSQRSFIGSEENISQSIQT